MLLLKVKANVEKYKTNIHICLPKFCSSCLLWPTTVWYLCQTVCLRKRGHFILHSKCSKNISNSEWVFYSTSWGLNKGVWDLTYPLHDQNAYQSSTIFVILWHLIQPVLTGQESRVHCLEKQKLKEVGLRQKRQYQDMFSKRVLWS